MEESSESLHFLFIKFKLLTDSVKNKSGILSAKDNFTKFLSISEITVGGWSFLEKVYVSNLSFLEGDGLCRRCIILGTYLWHTLFTEDGNAKHTSFKKR